MNAPQPLPLADRILDAIAKATSQRPAHAADVLALVGGEDADYWAAIEQLTQQRRINSAHLHRPATDPAPWLGIWPTGVCLPPPPLSGRHLSGLFVPHRHNDLRAAHAPRTAPLSTQIAAPAVNTEPPQLAAQEPIMPAITRTTEGAAQRRNTIVELVAGRTAAEGIPLKDIAEQLWLSVAGVEYLVKSLVEAGKVKKVRQPGELFNRLYDPTTEASAAADTAPAPASNVAAGLAAIADALALAEPAESAAPAGPDHFRDATKMVDQPAYRAGDIQVHELVAGDAAATAATDTAHEVRLGLWDDGSLTIIDGDEVLEYGPDVVRRLALLLGVPRAEVRA